MADKDKHWRRIGKEIEELKQEVSRMARAAESIMDLSLQVLKERDLGLIQKVLDMDKELNQWEIKMDQMCMQLLALKDPYGLDFRFIFSVVKTTRDLERVGDESKNVAKWTRKLQGAASPELLALAQKSRETFQLAVEALADIDSERAAKVMSLDQEVDRMEDEILSGTEDLATAFIAKTLERIGDLSSNIAENVIFSVEAEDIRHTSGNWQGSFQK